MKKLKYTLLALALGIYSAQASTLTVLHDTQKKLDFTFDWHDIAGPFIGPYPYQGVSSITLDLSPYLSDDPNLESVIDLKFMIDSPLFHDPPDMFTQRAGMRLVYLPYPSNIIRIDEAGVYLGKMKLADDLMSVRLTFHEKDYLPAPIPVPDTGSTLGMLAFALAGFPFLRRK